MVSNFDFTKETCKLRTPENEKIILEPYTYLLKTSGNGYRKQLSIAFNHWLKIADDKLETINEVIEMLHNSTFLIDDIEDSSIMRRGCPTAQKIYGLPLSLNCGNYVYFLALQKCLTLNDPRVPIVFTEQMLQLHRGQGMDIYWRDTFTCPSEEEYKIMAILKTGGTFALAFRLMQLFSVDNKNYIHLLDNLGLLFQIRNDFVNLIDEKYHSKKTFAEDLTEGKFSYPIVAAIHKDPTDHQIISILRQRTDELFLKRHCVKLIRKMGVLDYTAKLLIDLENQCKKSIEEFGGNAHLVDLLNRFSKIYREFKSEDLQL